MPIHFPKPKILAIAVVLPVLFGCAGSRNLSQAAMVGEWVGAFELAKELVYLRVRIEAGARGVKLTVLTMQPGAPGSSGNVRVELPRIHFELPRGSHPLAFDGHIQGDLIAGDVQHAGHRGTFQLLRVVEVDPKIYDVYSGAYEVAPDRVVFIRRGDRLKLDPPSSIQKSWLYYVEESGRTGVLYPSSETTFFSGTTYLVPVPVDVRVTFVRGQRGVVTGLIWREKGREERFAPRSARYHEVELTFRNGEVTLAGRLLLPSTAGQHSAVVLVSGAGPANRNQEYEIIGDIFAWHGIAALVYDKRGTGASEGDWHEASFADLADDALAGVEILGRRDDIDPTQIGLWGISEGGYVAPLAASRSGDIASLVVVSAGGTPGAEAEVAYVASNVRADGSSDQEIEQAVAFAKLERDFAMTGRGWGKLQAVQERARNEKWLSYTWTGIFDATSSDHWSWRWYRRRAEIDAVPVLRKVRCPVLAIWGALDTYGPPEISKARFEEALSEGGNRHYTTRVFPQGDHTLGRVEAGGDLGFRTYVAGYFALMTEWLLPLRKLAEGSG